MAARVSMLRRVSFLTTTGMARVFPSFAKAELSQLRFGQTLECRRVVAARGSMLRRVSFLTTVMETRDTPPSRRRGGRDLKKLSRSIL